MFLLILGMSTSSTVATFSKCDNSGIIYGVRDFDSSLFAIRKTLPTRAKRNKDVTLLIGVHIECV